MSHYSQSYPVKSNAARAAAKHGLTRSDLVQDDAGAWRFMILDAVTPEPATTLPATVESVPDPVAATVADVSDISIGEMTGADLAKPAVRAARAKVARRTGKVTKSPAKPAKVAKTPRAGKVKREGHGKFTGSPAFQGRRASQGRRGIMDQVEKMLRAKWCPADAMLKETGWVSNTFRGVLGKFRRDGMDVRCEKRDGVTCYRIAA